jgi:hypothetical protein
MSSPTSDTSTAASLRPWRPWLQTLSVLGLLALPKLASADVLTTYDATKCWGDNKNDDTTANFQRTTGKIKNISTQTMNIHCPIVKTTSGPGITNDQLAWADVPVQTSGGAAVECRINMWHSETIDDSIGNLIWISSNSRSTTGTMRVDTSVFSPTSFWNFGSDAGVPKWLFADLICELPPQASITNYSVNERGTNQTGYRIYPSLSCSPDSTNNQNWRNIPERPAPDISFGGFNMGQATGGTKYAMKCPLPANTIVRYSVMRALGGQTLGCKLNSNNFSTFTWTAADIGEEWHSQILRQFTQPMIVAPVSNGMTDNLFCGVNSSSGDGKLISYRTRPQPSRASWVTSASIGGSTSNVKDNNGSTRWTTGTNGASGQWFKVDFGTARGFNQITMDSGTSANDFARNFQVQVSNNNSTWTTVATGTGSSRFVSVNFDEQSARYVRVVLTSGFGSWWSIHELNAYSVWEWE